MAFSDYLENVILNYVFGKIWYSPQELWVGLSLANPQDNALGLDEPSSDDGYSRVLTHPVDWASSTLGEVFNNQAIVFPTATSDWGEIMYFALFDAAQMVIYSELVPNESVSAGQRPRFSPFRLRVRLE